MEIRFVRRLLVRVPFYPSISQFWLGSDDFKGSSKWVDDDADIATDVDVNFDLCKDDGAAAALFGSSTTQQVNGTASLVDCGEWTGSGNLT